MKYLYLFAILLPCFCISQTPDVIKFDYDASGNQIKRYLIDIDSHKHQHQNPKNESDLTDSDLIRSDIYDDIKYYPNPVKEELYVFWDLVNDNNVQLVQLYNMNGQLLKSIDKLDKANNCTLPFQTLPEGIYDVILIFKKGEKKSLKVIKNGS